MHNLNEIWFTLLCLIKSYYMNIKGHWSQETFSKKHVEYLQYIVIFSKTELSIGDCDKTKR
jgi:hypothetical protein